MNRRVQLPTLEKTLQEALSLLRQGRLDAARRLYRSVLQTSPDNFDALHNLGLVELQLERFQDAAALFRRALRQRPNSAMACNSRGLALQALGQNDAALTWYEKALAIEPRYANAYYNLGNLLKNLERPEDAVASYEKALALKPDLDRASIGLIGALLSLWRLDDAIAQLRKALAIQPDLPVARSDLVYLSNFRPQETPETLFAAHRAWGELHAPAIASLDLRFARAADPDRRLRVGYVSPDFRNHAEYDFVAPVLEAHDRRQIEIVCYSDVARPDRFTKHLTAKVERWVSIHGMEDAAVAERIRGDGIDILVDLAGHTAGNRLKVFAAKPAPVQVAWVGYPETRGLAAIDYRISDAVLDPEGSERFSTEKLIRLPHFCCWRSRFDAAPVQAAPVTRTGRVTFGSVNQLHKMTPEVIELWARVLRSEPGSRLFLVASALANPSVRERVTACFADAGIGRDRLALTPTVPTPDHLALYHQVDIALDPFPFNGHTTSCEALWMGVPVITLLGDRRAARTGASILTIIGLPELVAETAEAYVAIAVSLAHDPDRLAALRAGMRERLRTSPLGDVEAMTRAVETAYRGAWRRWCEKPKPASAAIPRGRTETGPPQQFPRHPGGPAESRHRG
jgi:protein O-GlcNAc transferase